MNNKILCIGLSAAMILALCGCSKKEPKISGEYEGEILITGEREEYEVDYFESSLPVYLTITKDNTFTLELDFRALTDNLNYVADEIEANGLYTVKDISVLGTDYYEGTVELVDGQYVFSGDIEFTATYETRTIYAESLFGADIIEFE